MSVGSVDVGEKRADRKKMANRVCAALAAISLLFCVVSPFASSTAFLIVPLFGLASIALGIYGRAWWACLAGLLELVSPAVLIYLVYYALAQGA